MTRSDWVAEGEKLAAEIEVLSAQYHVKSDQHENLSWEAAILKAKSRDLQRGCGVRSNLVDSALTGKWGASLAETLADVSDRIKQFHQAYHALVEQDA